MNSLQLLRILPNENFFYFPCPHSLYPLALFKKLIFHKFYIALRALETQQIYLSLSRVSEANISLVSGSYGLFILNDKKLEEMERKQRQLFA